MPTPKIEDLRFSSSSIDEFFKDSNNRVASAGRIRVSNLSILAGFDIVGEDKLVRISQKDFWHLGQDDDGYFIERLVDDGQGPVKF